MATSFRDPAGHLLSIDGRIIRIVNQSGEADVRSFLASRSSQELVNSGKLVSARILEPTATSAITEALRVEIRREDVAMILEHERVPFQSFPYEWPPEMLHAAAELTIDLAENTLEEGLGLKDATPYNILFQGPRPVFVDWLSFERRDPTDATWLPYAQFVRTFLLPMLVNGHFGLRLDQLLLTNRDGVEPETVYRMCSPVRRLLPPFLTLVSFPSWLSRKATVEESVYRPHREASPEKARFILKHIFKGLRRRLRSLEPRGGKSSTWSDYMSQNRYTEDYFPLKQAFVQDALDQANGARVLDVGCNTGFFSALAARSGASVVAIDYDPVVVGEVWRLAGSESLNVLPLVVNLARPSPSTGWLNGECASFLDRARGSFDVVLMLAVIHHMIVTERIPLTQILTLASELTTKVLVIEYVPPDDPMFRRLTRGRDHLHQDLTRAAFEAACRDHFEVVRSEPLGNSGRWLYLLVKQ